MGKNKKKQSKSEKNGPELLEGSPRALVCGGKYLQYIHI